MFKFRRRMAEFLRNLLALTKPYRLRLVLGVLFGILAGLIEPTVIALVPLVGHVVFPDAGGGSALAIFKNAPAFIAPLVDFVTKLFNPVTSWYSGLQAGHPVAAKLLIISLVPL